MYEIIERDSTSSELTPLDTEQFLDRNTNRLDKILRYQIQRFRSLNWDSESNSHQEPSTRSVATGTDTDAPVLHSVQTSSSDIARNGDIKLSRLLRDFREKLLTVDLGDGVFGRELVDECADFIFRFGAIDSQQEANEDLDVTKDDIISSLNKIISNLKDDIKHGSECHETNYNCSGCKASETNSSQNDASSSERTRIPQILVSAMVDVSQDLSEALSVMKGMRGYTEEVEQRNRNLRGSSRGVAEVSPSASSYSSTASAKMFRPIDQGNYVYLGSTPSPSRDGTLSLNKSSVSPSSSVRWSPSKSMLQTKLSAYSAITSPILSSSRNVLTSKLDPEADINEQYKSTRNVQPSNAHMYGKDISMSRTDTTAKAMLASKYYTSAHDTTSPISRSTSWNAIGNKLIAYNTMTSPTLSTSREVLALKQDQALGLTQQYTSPPKLEVSKGKERNDISTTVKTPLVNTLSSSQDQPYLQSTASFCSSPSWNVLQSKLAAYSAITSPTLSPSRNVLTSEKVPTDTSPRYKSPPTVQLPKEQISAKSVSSQGKNVLSSQDPSSLQGIVSPSRSHSRNMVQSKPVVYNAIVSPSYGKDQSHGANENYLDTKDASSPGRHILSSKDQTQSPYTKSTASERWSPLNSMLQSKLLAYNAVTSPPLSPSARNIKTLEQNRAVNMTSKQKPPSTVQDSKEHLSTNIVSPSGKALFPSQNQSSVHGSASPSMSPSWNALRKYKVNAYSAMTSSTLPSSRNMTASEKKPTLDMSPGYKSPPNIQLSKDPINSKDTSVNEVVSSTKTILTSTDQTATQMTAPSPSRSPSWNMLSSKITAYNVMTSPVLSSFRNMTASERNDTVDTSAEYKSQPAVLLQKDTLGSKDTSVKEIAHSTKTILTSTDETGPRITTPSPRRSPSWNMLQSKKAAYNVITAPSYTKRSDLSPSARIMLSADDETSPQSTTPASRSPSWNMLQSKMTAYNAMASPTLSSSKNMTASKWNHTFNISQGFNSPHNVQLSKDTMDSSDKSVKEIARSTTTILTSTDETGARITTPTPSRSPSWNMLQSKRAAYNVITSPSYTKRSDLSAKDISPSGRIMLSTNDETSPQSITPASRSPSWNMLRSTMAAYNAMTSPELSSSRNMTASDRNPTVDKSPGYKSPSNVLLSKDTMDSKDTSVKEITPSTKTILTYTDQTPAQITAPSPSRSPSWNMPQSKITAYTVMTSPSYTKRSDLSAKTISPSGRIMLSTNDETFPQSITSASRSPSWNMLQSKITAYNAMTSPTLSSPSRHMLRSENDPEVDMSPVYQSPPTEHVSKERVYSTGVSTMQVSPSRKSLLSSQNQDTLKRTVSPSSSRSWNVLTRKIAAYEAITSPALTSSRNILSSGKDPAVGMTYESSTNAQKIQSYSKDISTQEESFSGKPMLSPKDQISIQGTTSLSMSASWNVLQSKTAACAAMTSSTLSSSSKNKFTSANLPTVDKVSQYKSLSNVQSTREHVDNKDISTEDVCLSDRVTLSSKEKTTQSTASSTSRSPSCKVIQSSISLSGNVLASDMEHVVDPPTQETMPKPQEHVLSSTTPSRSTLWKVQQSKMSAYNAIKGSIVLSSSRKSPVSPNGISTPPQSASRGILPAYERIAKSPAYEVRSDDQDYVRDTTDIPSQYSISRPIPTYASSTATSPILSPTGNVLADQVIASTPTSPFRPPPKNVSVDKEESAGYTPPLNKQPLNSKNTACLQGTSPTRSLSWNIMRHKIIDLNERSVSQQTTLRKIPQLSSKTTPSVQDQPADVRFELQTLSGKTALTDLGTPHIIITDMSAECLQQHSQPFENEEFMVPKTSLQGQKSLTKISDQIKSSPAESTHDISFKSIPQIISREDAHINPYDARLSSRNEIMYTTRNNTRHQDSASDTSVQLEKIRQEITRKSSQVANDRYLCRKQPSPLDLSTQHADNDDRMQITPIHRGKSSQYDQYPRNVINQSGAEILTSDISISCEYSPECIHLYSDKQIRSLSETSDGDTLQRGAQQSLAIGTSVPSTAAHEGTIEATSQMCAKVTAAMSQTQKQTLKTSCSGKASEPCPSITAAANQTSFNELAQFILQLGRVVKYAENGLMKEIATTSKSPIKSSSSLTITTIGTKRSPEPSVNKTCISESKQPITPSSIPEHKSHQNFDKDGQNKTKENNTNPLLPQTHTNDINVSGRRSNQHKTQKDRIVKSWNLPGNNVQVPHCYANGSHCLRVGVAFIVTLFVFCYVLVVLYAVALNTERRGAYGVSALHGIFNVPVSVRMFEPII